MTRHNVLHTHVQTFGVPALSGQIRKSMRTSHTIMELQGIPSGRGGAPERPCAYRAGVSLILCRSLSWVPAGGPRISVGAAIPSAVRLLERRRTLIGATRHPRRRGAP